MTQLRRRTRAVALLLGTAAPIAVATTAAAQSAATPAVSVDSTALPCSATDDAAAVSGWHLVPAGKFAFCLPPGWKVTRSFASFGSATLRWGTGEHARGAPIAVGRVVVTQTSSGMGERRPPDVTSSPAVDGERTAETIGGQRADVWRTQVGAQFFTGAQWAMPHVYLTGEANSSADADLELAIMRTVRFPKP